MPELLTRKGSSSKLEEVIKNAGKQLTLITPYVKLSPEILARLQSAERRGVEIRLVCRLSDLKAEERTKLDSLKKLVLYSLEHLHAKCYANEQHVLITSMNLYEHSEANNWEMGVLLTEQDGPVYTAARSEITEILQAATVQTKAGGLRSLFSNPFQRTAAPPPKTQPAVATTKPAPPAQPAKSSRPHVGHCIRCSDEVRYRPQTPFCNACYSSWSYWGNENYAENVCHRCGKNADVSMARPLCLPCFREAPFN